MDKQYAYTQKIKYKKKDGTEKVYVCALNLTYTLCPNSQLRKKRAELRKNLMALSDNEIMRLYNCCVNDVASVEPHEQREPQSKIKMRNTIRLNIQNLTMEQLQ
jgi:GTP cyclohydrolase FolE2